MKTRKTLILAIAVQTPLALLFGHQYDMKVFMVSGYAVAHGLSPYEERLVEHIFQNPNFEGPIAGIGYLPLWSLVMGGIYILSYNIYPNLFIYNFASKLPILIGNIGLAYLSRQILIKKGLDLRSADRVWTFILINPYIVYTTILWGQFDTLVALFTILSMHYMMSKKIKSSAITLAIAVALKPIAIIFFPLNTLLVNRRLNLDSASKYTAIFCGVLIAISMAPFMIFSWSFEPILRNWDFHFRAAGALSIYNILEIFLDTNRLPPTLVPLGYLWIPVLAIGYVYAKMSTLKTYEIYLRWATIITLLFLLTRPWVSEQNLDLLLPLLALTVTVRRISWRLVTLCWIIPLTFTMLNVSLPQLLFLSFPEILDYYWILDSQINTIRLITRALIIVPWYFVGWYIIRTLWPRKDDRIGQEDRLL